MSIPVFQLTYARVYWTESSERLPAGYLSLSGIVDFVLESYQFVRYAIKAIVNSAQTLAFSLPRLNMR